MEIVMRFGYEKYSCVNFVLSMQIVVWEPLCDMFDHAQYFDS